MKKVPSHALMGVHSMIEMEAGFARVQPRVLPSTGAACANSSAWEAEQAALKLNRLRARALDPPPDSFSTH